MALLDLYLHVYLKQGIPAALQLPKMISGTSGCPSQKIIGKFNFSRKKIRIIYNVYNEQRISRRWHIYGSPAWSVNRLRPSVFHDSEDVTLSHVRGPPKMVGNGVTHCALQFYIIPHGKRSCPRISLQSSGSEHFLLHYLTVSCLRFTVA